MSLLNPVVTCGYVNTVHTVCYVVNKSFLNKTANIIVKNLTV